MNFGEKLFQAKLLSRLSHKVCRLLSSPVLLRKFTNKVPRTTLLFGTLVSYIINHCVAELSTAFHDVEVDFGFYLDRLFSANNYKGTNLSSASLPGR